MTPFSRALGLRRLAICICLVLWGCDVSDPNDIRIEDLFTISIAPRILPADGVARAVVEVTLQGETPTGVEVTFRTDMGRFASLHSGNEQTSMNDQEITLKVSARSQGVALISGTQAGMAAISGAINGFTAFDSAEFARVMPARLLLTADRSVLPANGVDRVRLTAELVLSDETRTVTEGTRVILEATDEVTGNPIPELGREATSDADGIASVDLFGTFVGWVVITAVVEDSPSVRGQIRVEFQSPT